MTTNKEIIVAEEALKGAMKREADTLRELLANLYEEEAFLRRGDSLSSHLLLQERHELLFLLGELRKERLTLTSKLGSVQKKEVKNFESLLDDSDTSIEILSLKEQMVVLMEKVALQEQANAHLCLAVQSQLLAPKEPKRKTQVATITEKN